MPGNGSAAAAAPIAESLARLRAEAAALQARAGQLEQTSRAIEAQIAQLAERGTLADARQAGRLAELRDAAQETVQLLEETVRRRADIRERITRQEERIAAQRATNLPAVATLAPPPPTAPTVPAPSPAAPIVQAAPPSAAAAARLHTPVAPAASAARPTPVALDGPTRLPERPLSTRHELEPVRHGAFLERLTRRSCPPPGYSAASVSL